MSPAMRAVLASLQAYRAAHGADLTIGGAMIPGLWGEACASLLRLGVLVLVPVTRGAAYRLAPAGGAS